MILCRALCKDLGDMLAKSLLRGPCMILYRALWGDLVEILFRSSLTGPWHEDLEDTHGSSLGMLMERSCMKVL